MPPAFVPAVDSGQRRGSILVVATHSKAVSRYRVGHLTGILTFFIALGTITVLMRLVRSMGFLPFAAYRS
jgi:undecaprenyl pyrophosphate phosphatase UppP